MFPLITLAIASVSLTTTTGLVAAEVKVVTGDIEVGDSAVEISVITRGSVGVISGFTGTSVDVTSGTTGG